MKNPLNCNDLEGSSLFIKPHLNMRELGFSKGYIRNKISSKLVKV